MLKKVLPVALYNGLLLQHLVGQELRLATTGKYVATIAGVRLVYGSSKIQLQYIYNKRTYVRIQRLVQNTKTEETNYKQVVYQVRLGRWISLSSILTKEVLSNQGRVDSNLLPRYYFPSYGHRVVTHNVTSKKRKRDTIIIPDRPMKKVALPLGSGGGCIAPGCNQSIFYTCKADSSHTFCLHHYKQVLLQEDFMTIPLCPASVYCKDSTCYESLHSDVDLLQLSVIK